MSAATRKVQEVALSQSNSLEVQQTQLIVVSHAVSLLDSLLLVLSTLNSASATTSSTTAQSQHLKSDATCLVREIPRNSVVQEIFCLFTTQEN